MTRYTLLRHVNISRHILNRLVGHDHPIWSRVLVGSLILVGAAFISEASLFLRLAEKIIDAIGAIPWVEYITAASVTKEEPVNLSPLKSNIMKSQILLRIGLIIALLASIWGGWYVYTHEPKMKIEDAIYPMPTDRNL